MTRRWCAAAVLLAACGGGAAGAGKVRPASTASVTVQNFMRAVADSNLDAMAALWGTTRGPAGQVKQPSDYERRIAVMQAYLSSDDYRIVSDQQDGPPTRHAVQVQIRRQACTWDVPFSVIQLADGTWLVNQVDLTAAGNPAKPCNPSDTTAQDTSSASAP